MKFYSSWYSPFAQRTWLALLHKGVDFEYIEVDPYEKTESWIRVSRGMGQVPVLVDGTGKGEPHSVPGSLRTLEFIDEEFASQGTMLFPGNPAGRADIRFWLDYFEKHVMPHFYGFLTSPRDSEHGQAARQNMEDGLAVLAAAIHTQGPYFSGNKPCAIDLALAPFALRFEILLPHYRDYMLPDKDSAWQRYHAWWQVMARDPHLPATYGEGETYKERLIDFYLPYSEGRA
jgi:glutathione S-transferase